MRRKVGWADKVIGNDEVSEGKKFLAHHPEEPPMEIVGMLTFFGSLSGISYRETAFLMKNEEDSLIKFASQMLLFLPSSRTFAF